MVKELITKNNADERILADFEHKSGLDERSEMLEELHSKNSNIERK